MLRHRFGGGLLQRLVDEQPVVGACQLRRRLAAQHRRLHEHDGAISETLTRRSDVGDEGGIGEPEASDLTQRLRACFAAQIGDVVEAEIYDGLTPVTITL